MTEAGPTDLLIEIPDPLIWIPVPVTTVVGTVPVTRERCLWGGWSSDGLGGGFTYLWDQAGPGGLLIAAIDFGVTTAFTAAAPWPGVYCPNGLSVQAGVAGNRVVVYHAPLDR